MKKIIVLLFVLISVVTFSQKKETFDDRAELERITKAINLSGESLRKSAQQTINGLLLSGAGALVSVVGFVVDEPAVSYTGIGISAISIPFHFASIFNKRKAGDRMMEFTLEETPNNTPNSSVESNQSAPKNIEPKYKVGQTVYFFKSGKLTEAKIILVDTIGLRIEYFDSEKNKTKNKFVNFDKVLLEEPK